jgi:DNA-binding response OmpR family regulator
MATILVVDDDDAIRAFVAMALADEGYAVREARDGREALAAAAADQPCAILLDMRMPTMDGWAFAAAYRARTDRPAPLVCMTAAADVARRGAEIAAEAALAKPFDLDDLVATVGRFCAPG